MTIVGHAIAIAAEVHKDQVDKGNEPYIYHCLEVMRRADERYSVLAGVTADSSHREWVLCAAVLHDVVEDFMGTSIEKRALQSRIYERFPNAVSNAIDALTKHDAKIEGTNQYVEGYDEYIERVSRDWIARIVKLCDLSHNLEAWRIPSGKITERDYKRWDKYHRAFVRLMRED